MDKARVRLFIDFWNLQLNWNEYHNRAGTAGVVAIPWKDLPTVLAAEVSKGQPVRYTGTHIYASVDPNNPKDKKLSKWLHHTLASFTGYIVDVRERKPRRVIKCQEENCKTSITQCPACKQPLKGTVEKGVDAAIITDLITLAFDDNYDIAILISGDADHAPVVRYIQRKTDKQVIQAFFKAHGDELRNACWDHVFFDDLMPKLALGTVPVVAAAPVKPTPIVVPPTATG
jgi:uncharacterized LabA/DUF88 family protein